MRRLFLGFFIYLIIEGALRKWAFPQFGAELFLLKDVLLIAALLIFAGTRPRAPLFLTTQSRRAIRWVSLIWPTLIFGHFLATGPSISGAVGLRYYIVPIGILVLLPWAISDIKELNVLMRRYILMAVAVSGVAFLQYASPPDSLINVYAWQTSGFESVATFGIQDSDSDFTERARVTGTFSFITPYTSYLQFVLLCCLAMMCQSVTKRVIIQMGVSFAILFVCVVMTASRSGVFPAVVFSVPFLVLIARRHGWAAGWLFLAILVVMAVGINSAHLFLARVEGAGDFDTRIIGALGSPIFTLRDASFIGTGVGSTFAGWAEIEGTLVSDDSLFDEIIHDRMGIELGTIGYSALLAIKTYFIFLAARLYFRVNDVGTKAWVLASVCYQASFAWQTPFYNATAISLYMASIAVLPLLEMNAGQRQARDTVARDVRSASVG